MLAIKKISKKKQVFSSILLTHNLARAISNLSNIELSIFQDLMSLDRTLKHIFNTDTKVIALTLFLKSIKIWIPT